MKADAYQVITDRILGLLQQGTIPWQKPWQGGERMPRNLVSRREYRGVNVFLLHAMMYESPFWLTFNQAKELGGHVKKGERSSPVVFWKWLDVQAAEEPTGKKRVPFLRYYSVFNVAQCEDIPPDKIPSLGERQSEHKPIEEAERIVAGMPKKPEIRHGGGRACYLPSVDRVEMPRLETFRSGQDYYSVLFHELTHATGHESRLNRKGVAGSDGEWSAFGSTPYAREELVAEMGAAFLAGHAGIVERTIDNSAAYVQSWLQRLKDDNRLVVQAAAQAQKAADFILSRTFDGQEKEDGE
jgi:antirestriction protein ArdC